MTRRVKKHSSVERVHATGIAGVILRNPTMCPGAIPLYVALVLSFAVIYYCLLMPDSVANAVIGKCIG